MSSSPNESSFVGIRGVWESLESDSSGVSSQRRLHPTLAIYAFVDQPSRQLGIRIRSKESPSFDERDLADTKAITLDLQGAEELGLELTLRLEDFSSREIFMALCDDLVPRATACSDDVSAMKVLVNRFNHWKQFLKQAGSSGLSKEKQLGLFGELLTLSDVMLRSLSPAEAVSAWTGPANTPQDFQAMGIAIEVKTIVQSEPQSLSVNGERQLDRFGLSALVLVHHRVVAHLDSGTSLPELVESVRGKILGNSSALEEFDNRLLRAGYADHQAEQYSSQGYTRKTTSYYNVVSGFPCITESDLRPGMGGVRYQIDASACKPFEVGESTVLGWLSEPSELAELSKTEESDDVEYKQSAWAPMDEMQQALPAEAKKKISLELNLGIVKTIVAFLNSHGGELVIGVHDKTKEVTGIEADLDFLGRINQDDYQLRLKSLLTNNIDDLISANMRIRFEEHDSGTACHIVVRRSTTPRFGFNPARKENEQKRPIFWYREFNSTDTHEGVKIIDYWLEHSRAM